MAHIPDPTENVHGVGSRAHSTLQMQSKQRPPTLHLHLQAIGEISRPHNNLVSSRGPHMDQLIPSIQTLMATELNGLPVDRD